MALLSVILCTKLFFGTLLLDMYACRKVETQSRSLLDIALDQDWTGLWASIKNSILLSFVSSVAHSPFKIVAKMLFKQEGQRQSRVNGLVHCCGKKRRLPSWFGV